MITTRMKAEEISQEYIKDYTETLSPRNRRYAKFNKKSILRVQRMKEKTANSPQWAKCKGVRRIKTIRNNSYRAILWVSFDGENVAIKSTTYMILNDSITGKKVVFLFPVDQKSGLVKFSSTFFQEYSKYRQLKLESFEDLVDYFMSTEHSSGVNITLQDDLNPRYNCKITFGNNPDMMGFGGVYNDNPQNESSGNTYFFRHFSTYDILKKQAEEKGLNSEEINNPLQLFNKLKFSDNERDLELDKTLSDKQKEIEEAWKLYESSKIFGPSENT